MATLEQLQTSITKLPPDEALALVVRLRTSRRTVKKPTKLAAPKRSRAKKKPLTLNEMANMLTPEQKAKIKKELLGL